jgi:hypothetical protein
MALAWFDEFKPTVVVDLAVPVLEPCHSLTCLREVVEGLVRKARMNCKF